jgi:hypothetical protein
MSNFSQSRGCALAETAKSYFLPFAFVLLTFAGQAQASLTYNLNNTIGTGGVTGFIQTDGTTGILGSANITDWNLVIDDGSGTFNLLGPGSGNNSQLFMSVNASLSATLSDLLFDFSTFNGGVLFQNPNIGSSQNWYALEDQADGIGTGVAGSENLRVGFGTRQSTIRSGLTVIGSVPIPAAVWLFGSGLGLLGWFRRRQT